MFKNVAVLTGVVLLSGLALSGCASAGGSPVESTSIPVASASADSSGGSASSGLVSSGFAGVAASGEKSYVQLREVLIALKNSVWAEGLTEEYALTMDGVETLQTFYLVPSLNADWMYVTDSVSGKYLMTSPANESGVNFIFSVANRESAVFSNDAEGTFTVKDGETVVKVFTKDGIIIGYSVVLSDTISAAGVVKIGVPAGLKADIESKLSYMKGVDPSTMG